MRFNHQILANQLMFKTKCCLKTTVSRYCKTSLKWKFVDFDNQVFPQIPEIIDSTPSCRCIRGVSSACHINQYQGQRSETRFFMPMPPPPTAWSRIADMEMGVECCWCMAGHRRSHNTYWKLEGSNKYNQNQDRIIVIKSIHRKTITTSKWEKAADLLWDSSSL